MRWSTVPVRGGGATSLCLFLLCLGFPNSLRPQDIPTYRIDPSWPKPLPQNGILGYVKTVVLDKNDHIWVLHFPGTISQDERGLTHNPPLSTCCVPAASVLEFDEKGNLLKGWGGPGYTADWPSAEEGLWVEKSGNFWITGSWRSGAYVRRPEDDPGILPGLERRPWDRQALKFSKDGKLLLKIGRLSNEPLDNRNTDFLGGVSSIQVDESAHEVYLADGYLNSRIVVYDADKGVFKRGWGAYGIPLQDIENKGPEVAYDPAAPPSKQFRGPVVGLQLSTDGLLYFADRGNNRIQVFTKQGKFLKEFSVAPKTLGQGAPTALAFSQDPKQKYLFVGDGSNNVIWILNREDGAVLGKFGHRGPYAGQFDNLHSIAVDSRGNLYTGEDKYNNRLQKFVLAALR